jgi:hypothetical protein
MTVKMHKKNVIITKISVKILFIMLKRDSDAGKCRKTVEKFY